MTTWSVRIIKAEIYFVDDIEADTKKEAEKKACDMFLGTHKKFNRK